MTDGVVLYCDCARARIIPDEIRRQTRERLQQSGRPVLAVADLCGLAAARDPRLEQAARAGSLTVFACYPRAVRWLFHWAGFSLDDRRVRFLNMRESAVEEIDAVLAPDPGSVAPTGTLCFRDVDRADAGSRPWFPVIDYTRCTGCGQCKEFCLFGVYAETAEGRVEVRTPDACKDNCPACARMCPEVAIMFPKIEERSPINGAEDDPSGAEGKVRLTREQLFGTGALDRLRARQRPPLLK